jgi:hypothetical protein
MKFNNILLLAVLFVAQIGISQNYKFGKVSKEEIEETSSAIEPDAVASILYREFKTNFQYSQEDGFYAVIDVYERIKIYKKEGFDWGTKSINLYQGDGGRKEEITNLKAYTYKLTAEGKIEDVKLRKDGIFDEEANKYSEIKKFTMPDLSEGCVIEYKYTLKTPFIYNLDEYRFQELIPVNRVYLRFAAPEYISYKMHQKGWLAFKIDKDAKDRTMSYRYTVDAVTSDNIIDKTETAQITFREDIYEVDMVGVPSIKKEKFVGNIDNYSSSLKFELAYTKYPNSTYESFSHTWEDVSSSIYKSDSFGPELSKTGYFDKDIDNLILGVSNPTEKMMRIFEFVKTKMTWNSVHGFTTDEGVKTAYKEETGNVADINLMLTAMFRYAGLNANPILVSTKSFGIPIFPTRNGFNYVISGVAFSNEIFLFDATNKYGEVNILEEKLLNWQGRMIAKEGASAWVPLTPSKQAVKNGMITAKISEDNSIQGSLQSRVTGHYAMATREEYLNLSADERRKLIEEDKMDTEVSNIEIENLNTLHKPIKLKYEFTSLSGIDAIGDNLYFSPMLFLATLENPFKSDERKYPIDYGFPKKDRYLVTIEIPEGFIVESMPENVSFGLERNMGSYKYLISNTGNKIQLSVELSINEAILPAENYGGVKQFYELMVAKENEKIVLSKGR